MSQASFIGRKDELESLHGLRSKRTSSLIVVKGRRRIGKSRLVEKFAQDANFLNFTGIPPTGGTTAQTQRDEFSRQLSRETGLPKFRMDDWHDLFHLLSKETEKGRIVILFDEISWMGSEDPNFLGKLKTCWDLYFKKNPKLIFILCGSVSTWIEENIIKSTGFFGRISLYLTLEELPLEDCNTFLESQGFRGSIYEKFKILSVTGGGPWYLEQIQSGVSADENIKNLCFRKDGVLLHEVDLIFHELFSRRSEFYKRIVEILVNGVAEFNEIAKQLNYVNSGALSGYLSDLISSGFMSRDYTWHLKDGKVSRLSHYRLKDNYLRFYLKYVAPYRHRIIEDTYKSVSMSSFKHWDTVMGLQFENLVISNRKTILKELKIRFEDIVSDNPFFQRKTTNQKGCQIDYLIQTRFNTLFACEIKFSKHEISTEIINVMKERINRLKLPKGFSCWPVLIHVNGVHEKVEDAGYFSNIIDFSKFLEPSMK